MLKRLFLAGLLLVGGGGAKAAIVVTLDQVSGVDWTYNVRLQPGARMEVNDYFTVFDFPDLTAWSFTPDTGVSDRTFTPVVNNIGLTPAGVAPVDNPALKNVTIELTAGDTITPAQTGGATPLGQLTLTGLSGTQGPLINFASLTVQQAGGTPLSKAGFVPAPLPVPEPGTIGLMGTGLFAIGALALRRRKQATSDQSLST